MLYVDIKLLVRGAVLRSGSIVNLHDTFTLFTDENIGGEREYT